MTSINRRIFARQAIQILKKMDQYAMLSKLEFGYVNPSMNQFRRYMNPQYGDIENKCWTSDIYFSDIIYEMIRVGAIRLYNMFDNDTYVRQIIKTRYNSDFDPYDATMHERRLGIDSPNQMRIFTFCDPVITNALKNVGVSEAKFFHYLIANNCYIRTSFMRGSIYNILDSEDNCIHKLGSVAPYMDSALLDKM